MINKFLEYSMNKDVALNDLMNFLSIEGVTGQEKNIALAVKQSLIESKIMIFRIIISNSFY